MSSFRVGQKVVCVDVPWPDYTSFVIARGARLPEAGKIYTIRWIGVSPSDGHTYVRLEEIVNPIMSVPDWSDGECRFGARRFRPIVKRKTDISIFKAMLNPSRVKEVENA